MFKPFCRMELAALGEGLLTPEQTLSHIGTWVLFPPLLPLQYTLALAWGGGPMLYSLTISRQL